MLSDKAGTKNPTFSSKNSVPTLETALTTSGAMSAAIGHVGSAGSSTQILGLQVIAFKFGGFGALSYSELAGQVVWQYRTRSWRYKTVLQIVGRVE